MRSISLPNVNKLKEFSTRYEDLSVVIGWVVNLLSTFASVLDTPLRYPVKLLGSQSSIIDHIRVLEENRTVSREFPLFLKKAQCSRTDWERYEYGIYLLNKNLAQLRWQCGKQTSDVRPLLQNVADLMALGKDSFTIQEIVNALPRIRSLMAPPLATTGMFNSSNGITVALASKDNTNTTERSSLTKHIECYHRHDDVEYNSLTRLQSQEPCEVDQKQRTSIKDINVENTASNLSHNTKNRTEDSIEDIANAHNTRKLSNSSSSSYDTIETDRMSDDNIDNIVSQDVETIQCNQNISNLVRNITKENRIGSSSIKGDTEADEMTDLIDLERKSGQNLEEKPFSNSSSPGHREIVEIVDCDKDHAKEDNMSTLFWGDVTSRTNALSKPSSFQRKRTNQ